MHTYLVTIKEFFFPSKKEETPQQKMSSYHPQTLLKDCNHYLNYQCNTMEKVWLDFSSEAFALCVEENPPQTCFTWYEKLLSLTFLVKQDILDQINQYKPIPTDGTTLSIEDSLVDSLDLTNLHALLCILHMPEVQGHVGFFHTSIPIFVDISELCNMILFSIITPECYEIIKNVYILLHASSSQFANAN